MTLDEALSELGIDRGATAEQARRAYLRLLKTRKPDTDPVAFRRAREAYELVKELLEGAATGSALPAFSEPPVAATSAAARPGPDAAPQPTAPSTMSGVPLDVPTPDAIRGLLEKRQMRLAAEELTRVYDAASRSVNVAAPPIGLTLQVLLTLHEGGHFSTAEPLRLAAQRWLDASGGEAKLLEGPAIALWKILGELATFGSELSDDVRITIVNLACGEPSAVALARLQAHRQTDRATAERDATVLAAHPNLPSCQVIVAVLRGDDAAPPPVVVRRGVPSLRLLFGAFAGLALAAGGIFNSCEKVQAPAAAVYVSPEPTTSIGPRPALASAMSLAGAIEAEARREQALESVRDAADVLHLALDRGDCAAATGAMDDMRRALAVDGSASPRLSSNVDDLDRRLAEACGR